MMDLKEFERQVLAGEITDFEPYFKGQWDHQLPLTEVSGLSLI